MLTNDLFLKDLGLFLKNKRIEAGLTQKDVAKKMGYTSPQFISNWERGLTAPPLSTIRSLIKLYNLQAQEIFNFIAEAQLDILKKELLETKSS